MDDGVGIVFDHIGLHVGDMESATTFFVDHLQLDVIDQEMSRDDFLLAASGAHQALRQTRLRFPETNSEVRIIENRGAPLADADHANPGTCHVCLYTDDLDSTWRYLESQGTELCSSGVIGIKGGVFDGGKCIYCVGPDGFRIEFLDGPAYLDGSSRDPKAVPIDLRANEASHIGIHVRDRDASLAFYRDLLGIVEVAGWLEKTESTRQVIGYSTAELWMTILRLPGTQSYFEVIEYRGTKGTPIDNSLKSNGACHLAFRVANFGELRLRLTAGKTPILEDLGNRIWCEDPDGYRVLFEELEFAS